MRTMETMNYFSGLLLCCNNVLCPFSASACALCSALAHSPRGLVKAFRKSWKEDRLCVSLEPMMGTWVGVTDTVRSLLCVLTLPFDTSFPHLPAKAYHLLDLSNLEFLTLAAVEWLSKSLMFYCKQSACTV